MSYPLSTSDPMHYVGLGKQVDADTEAASSVFVPYRAAVSLDHNQSGDDIYEAGTGPYLNRRMKTGHMPGGEFGFGCRPATTAEIAAYFLGADSVSGSGPYTHTITPSTQNTWLSVDQCAGDAGDIIERFVGTQLTSFGLVAEEGNDAVATVAWQALTPTWRNIRQTPAYESGVNGSTPGANLRHTDATYTIDGAAATNVQAFDLSLEWRLDDVQLNKITRSAMMKLELTGTVKFRR